MVDSGGAERPSPRPDAVEPGHAAVVLRGASLLDPASRSTVPTTLAWAGGRLIARDGVAESLPHTREPIDIPDDALIVPGLVDLHTHVFAGVGDGVDADVFCLDRGSTTVADGGTAGAATFAAFAAIARGYRTRVLAWLNLSSIGLVDTRVGELVAGPYVDLARAIETAREYPDLVIGFKARLSTYAAGAGVHRILDPLLAAAAATGLPVMVHIGDTDERLAAIVGRLRPGDVVTHALTGRKHGILVGDRLDPAILEAQKRGVIFDAARGSNHLSFPVLETATEAGFLPDTLSTDMNLRTLGIPGFGLLTLGTYLLSVGVALPEVIERMTVRPAAVLGLDIGRAFGGSADAVPAGAAASAGDLADAGDSPDPGDVTVIRVIDGPFEIADVDGRARTVQQRLEPWATVRAGRFALTGTVE
jgi:dihydroorotase